VASWLDSSRIEPEDPMMQVRKGAVLRIFTTLIAMVLLSSCATTIKSQKESAKVAQLQLELGVAYMEQGHLDLAMVNLKKSLLADPDNPEALYALALLYLRSGNEDEAEQSFLQAMRERKSYPEAQNGYGVLLCRQGRQQEAAAYFEMAMHDPDNKTPNVAGRNSEICGDEMR